MPNNVLERETKTKERYLKDLERRSFNTAKGHKTSINSFESYLAETKADLKKPLNTLSGFVEWLEIGGKSAVTINGYVNKVKKYLRLCYGIKLDSDDFKDFVALPQVIDEELDPLSKDEFKLIIESARNPRRKALYWFIASTGCRIAEAVQVRKHMIDFSVSPALVTLPAKITKGKKRTRYQYLTRENTPLIRSVCNKLNDNDLVFTKSEKLVNALSNEQHSLQNLLESMGMNEKYEHNGHLKKSFHSMRAFVSSQIYNSSRDSEYSHAYLGHDTYLNQYLRKSDKERAEMFNEVESALTIFSEITARNDLGMKKELNEIKSKMEKYKVLDNILDNLDQPKLEALLKQ